MTPEEFDRQFAQEFATQTIPQSPYGIHPNTVKTGLTKRGKTGIAVAAAVLAGGTLLGYTHYSTQQAENANKAQELALKQQELRLEEMRELNRQATANQKTQTGLDTTRQKQIDTCVAANKSLVGKQLGTTLDSIVEACQKQYQNSMTSTGMLVAAADTTPGDSGDGPGTGLILGAAVLGLGAVAFARKATRPNPS